MTAKRDVQIFERNLDRMFASITSPKEMRAIGKDAIEIIVERTRGEYKGVKKPGGNTVTLKGVTKKYAKWRRAQKNKHPSAAKGRRSNLTLTGEMLDKLIILKATKRELYIGHRDKKNASKAEGQEAQGRPFIYLGKKEINNIVDRYDERISRQSEKV